jgi:hypothetical protein
VCDNTPHSKPMSMTSGGLHRVYLKINTSFEHRSPSPSERTLLAKMNLESVTLYLAMEHPGALEIHAEVHDILGQGTVGYSMITRYLRKRSFPHSSESAERRPKSGVAIQLTMLFCKPSMNNLFRHFDNLRRGH